MANAPLLPGASPWDRAPRRRACTSFRFSLRHRWYGGLAPGFAVRSNAPTVPVDSVPVSGRTLRRFPWTRSRCQVKRSGGSSALGPVVRSNAPAVLLHSVPVSGRTLRRFPCTRFRCQVERSDGSPALGPVVKSNAPAGSRACGPVVRSDAPAVLLHLVPWSGQTLRRVPMHAVPLSGQTLRRFFCTWSRGQVKRSGGSSALGLVIRSDAPAVPLHSVPVSGRTLRRFPCTRFRCQVERSGDSLDSGPLLDRVRLRLTRTAPFWRSGPVTVELSLLSPPGQASAALLCGVHSPGHSRQAHGRLSTYYMCWFSSQREQRQPWN